MIGASAAQQAIDAFTQRDVVMAGACKLAGKGVAIDQFGVAKRRGCDAKDRFNLCFMQRDLFIEFLAAEDGRE